MSDDLADWPRPYYQEPGGNPFLFYVVYGAFQELPAMDGEKYRSEGVPAGLELSHYGDDKHPDILAQFQKGYLWDELAKHRPALAKSVQGSDECLILRGELEDQSDLNYLRDTVGLLTFLLDNGGITVFDPWMFHWWDPRQWRERIFLPNEAVPHHHIVILNSEEEEDVALTWFHTRGMRKFGRPDLSVHRVPPRHREAVVELCNRFIEFHAFGGIIEEGQEVRMKPLPPGMVCRHAGDLEDPDFNNIHVEITPPAEEA